MEFDGSGYEWIRESLIRNSSIHIEIQDSDGNSIVRLGTSDSRVSWTHTEGNNPMELSVELAGSDADISLPVTIDQAVLFPDASSTNNLTPAKSVATTTMDTDSDQVTVKVPVYIPQ